MKRTSTNKKSGTDWERLRKLQDEEIDVSDIPVIDRALLKKMVVRMPEKKAAVSIRLDPGVIGWFKRQGQGYQTRINAVLRSYVEAHSQCVPKTCAAPVRLVYNAKGAQQDRGRQTMKVIVMLCMLALPMVSTASTNEYRKLTQQLEGLTAVDGSAVGAHGTPGRFYTLSLDILAQGTKPDFQRMLSSTNPVVRLMGVYCLVNTHTNMSELGLPATIFADTSKVYYAPGGCSMMRRTVSDIAQEFIRNPQGLGSLRREK